MARQGEIRRTAGGAAVAVVAAVTASLVGGCATTPNTAASVAPPRNYRQPVAVKLRQMEDPAPLLYVGVTTPKQMWTGIQNGGTRPAVCVQVERPNIFGARAAWYYLFYFENGQAEGHRMMAASPMQQAMFACQPPLTPITSLVRSRR